MAIEEKSKSTVFAAPVFWAADRGWLNPQLILFLMYKNGWGVKQDWQEAYFRFSLALALGLDRRLGFFGLQAYEETGTKMLESHLTPEQIAAVKKRVEERKPATAIG